jgi:hypothetical protein
MLLELRNNMLDFAENIINQSNLSKKSVGIVLRSLHFTIPVIIAILFVFGSIRVFKMVFVFNVIVFILFITLDGCILSRLEQKIMNDDFTVIDPFLELIRVDITNENRKNYSIYSGIFGLIFSVIVFYFRFCHNVEVI